MARYLAGIVGHAHGRQMKLGQRRAWRVDLAKNHKAALDAPSWLWSVSSNLSLDQLTTTMADLHCLRPLEQKTPIIQESTSRTFWPSWSR